MKQIQEIPGQVGIGRAYADFFKGLIEFRGRSTRAGYWWVQLLAYAVNFVVMMAVSMSLVTQALSQYGDDVTKATSQATSQMTPIILILSLVTAVVELSLVTRRNRDVGITGRGTAVLLVVQYALVVPSWIAMIQALVAGTAMTASSNGVTAFLTLALSIFQFVLKLLPTDSLTTRSDGAVARFFMRYKADAPN
ncbi:DUF805 domain-containing protein [Lacticaseibacillus parakribbianus]|uniref:DUF805 domain-containing protein n=1 Tax=Lacticaseibacillus parakribbianus TaxID=2970927 RepID=UPI0021CB90A9|nr:DUF805 domain-containing protein [Lacticaseibacillus parakribbianus]